MTETLTVPCLFAAAQLAIAAAHGADEFVTFLPQDELPRFIDYGQSVSEQDAQTVTLDGTAEVIVIEVLDRADTAAAFRSIPRASSWPMARRARLSTG